MPFIFALKDTELKETEPTFISPKGISIMLIRKQGSIYALRNKCSHMWCSFKGAKLEGYILICPCHDWRYDIRTGQFLDAKEITLETYPVKLEAGNIMINMSESKAF